MALPRLHVITDAGTTDRPLELARAALQAGSIAVQVRSQVLSDRRLFELAARIRALCLEQDGSCIVNDRTDVALAVGADGVHVGQDDLPVGAVRRLVPDGFWVGATARDRESAISLREEGTTYLGAGPVYRTDTKAGLPEPIGPEGLRKIAEAVDIPVIAIGGVTVDRVPEVMTAGAYGVAVVSAVSRADDPTAATAGLLEALEKELE